MSLSKIVTGVAVSVDEVGKVGEVRKLTYAIFFTLTTSIQFLFEGVKKRNSSFERWSDADSCCSAADPRTGRYSAIFCSFAFQYTARKCCNINLHLSAPLCHDIQITSLTAYESRFVRNFAQTSTNKEDSQELDCYVHRRAVFHVQSRHAFTHQNGQLFGFVTYWQPFVFLVSAYASSATFPKRSFSWLLTRKTSNSFIAMHFSFLMNFYESSL